MSKPSERCVLQALGALAFSIPVCAISGVTVGDAAPAPAPAPALRPTVPPPTARPLPPAGGYQIRCWQHGRLLFEENHVMLPAGGAQYGVRVSGTDRNGRPMYLAETENATCLVRGAVDEPGYPPR